MVSHDIVPFDGDDDDDTVIRRRFKTKANAFLYPGLVGQSEILRGKS